MLAVEALQYDEAQRYRAISYHYRLSPADILRLTFPQVAFMLEAVAEFNCGEG